MNLRLVDQDPVQPTAIEHKCDEDNYIVYHFDGDGAYFWARTYLDDIKTVSLYGPFENRATMKPIGVSVNDAVLVYLQRRFSKVELLRDDGAVPT